MQSQQPLRPEPKPPATTQARFERYVERVTLYAGREIKKIESKIEPKLVPLEKDSVKKTATDKTENFSSNVFKMLGNYFLLSNEKRLKPETKEALNQAAVDVKKSGHTLLGGFIKTVQAGIDKLNSWRFKEEISSRLEDDWIEVPEEFGERNLPPTEKHVHFEDEEKEKSANEIKDPTFKEEDRSDLIKESKKGIQPKPGPVQGAITRGGTPVIPQSNRGFADLSGLGSVPAPDYIEEEEQEKKENPLPIKDAGVDVNPYDNAQDWLTGRDEEATKDEGKINVSEEDINPKEDEDWILENDEEEWKEEGPEKKEPSKEESGVIKPEPGQVKGAVSRGGTVIPEKPGGTGLAELLNISQDKDEPPVEDYDVEEKTEKAPFTSGTIISRRVPGENKGLGLGGLTETQENKSVSAEPKKPAKNSPNKPDSIFSRRRFPRQNPSIVKKAFERPEKVEKEKENKDGKEEGEIA